MAGRESKKPKKNSAKKPASAKKKSKSNKPIPAWFSVTDLEQLNVLANPKRQKILGEFVDEARTTKQVAERLGEPPTRLYHHVDALARHGLLVLEREVPKRGTTEKYYRAVARQFRVDESCLADPGFADENSRVMTEMLDQARSTILQTLAEFSENPQDAPYCIATSGLINTTEKGIERTAESMIKNLDRQVSKPSKSQKSDRRDYRIMVLVYPEPDTNSH